MADDYKIDGHKLGYHPRRVADWFEGQNVYPLYIEISPSGTCNHRCVFCTFDFVGYQKRFLDTAMLQDRLSEMARLGIKSVHYAGEGEPLLHKDIADIVRHTAEEGLDVGISTNGVLLDVSLAEKLLPYCVWIKVSFNAGEKETYAKVHRCAPSDYDKVMSNLALASKIRDAGGYECTLGFQMVVLPENGFEALLLAKKARDIGMDYMVVKPHSRHSFTKSLLCTEANKEVKRWQYMGVKYAETVDFKVIIRENAFQRATEEVRPYGRCLALPFWSYIDAGGNVWGCLSFIGDNRFYYGNIHKNTFGEIWEGDLRRKTMDMMKEFDVVECKVNCRMDEINRYLWELMHPGGHVNFI